MKPKELKYSTVTLITKMWTPSPLLQSETLFCLLSTLSICYLPKNNSHRLCGLPDVTHKKKKEKNHIQVYWEPAGWDPAVVGRNLCSLKDIKSRFVFWWKCLTSKTVFPPVFLLLFFTRGVKMALLLEYSWLWMLDKEIFSLIRPLYKSSLLIT